MSTYTTPGAILFRYIPGVGRVAVNSCGTTSQQFGNVLLVDSVYGNDGTGSPSGTPYKTVGAAVAAATSGTTVWIFPGTYTLASGLVLPDGISLRGLSLQTTILQMNVTASATMLTMGESCRVEDLTLNLTCTGSTNNVVLRGIVFGGTSSQTSKLRTSVLTVRNSTMSKTLTSTVTGIEFSGTGALSSSSFSFNSVKGSTINVFSNGVGNKRGLLVSKSNQVSSRDTNVYVAQPPDTDSTGSYVGVEVNDPPNLPSYAGNTGSIQLRSTTVGVVFPTGVQTYTASDILQTTPATITDPTYLASAGIQIGPGTDLVTKSAGTKGFSTYVYPTVLFYGLKGTITSATNNSYLWIGTQAISAGVFPDNGTPAAYFRVQQPVLISGLSCATNVAPGSGTTNSITLTVRVTPSGGSITDTVFTVTISGGNTSGSFYNGSVRCGTGDLIHLYMTYTSTTPANAAHDISAQIDLF
jgi:hypothetical protein